MTIQPPGNSEAQIGKIFQSGSFLFFSPDALLLFLLALCGGLPCDESRCVGHVDAEEEQERLAVAVSGSDASHTVVEFLIAETALHDRCAQIADDAPGHQYFRGFILGFGTLADTPVMKPVIIS